MEKTEKIGISDILGAAGRYIAGIGIGLNLPKINVLGQTPQGIGAFLAGRTEPFPTWRIPEKETADTTTLVHPPSPTVEPFRPTHFLSTAWKNKNIS